MNKKDTIKEKLRELFALTKKLSFFDAKLKDGSILRTEDEALNKGSKVVLISVDGVESEVSDGDHTSVDGFVINVKSGVIEAITDAADAVKTEEAIAPIENAEATTDATSTPDAVEGVDGADITSLMECIKNLTDRVAALESSSSETTMTVEKMSAEPAAKPFNFEPMGNGSIGSELERYKNEHKAKLATREKQMMDFAKVRNTPSPVEFSLNEKSNNQPKPKTFNFNLGGGFDISSAK